MRSSNLALNSPQNSRIRFSIRNRVKELQRGSYKTNSAFSRSVVGHRCVRQTARQSDLLQTFNAHLCIVSRVLYHNSQTTLSIQLLENRRSSVHPTCSSDHLAPSPVSHAIFHWHHNLSRSWLPPSLPVCHGCPYLPSHTSLWRIFPSAASPSIHLLLQAHPRPLILTLV